MRKTYLLGACRTPIGSLGGSLKNIGAVQLGAIVIHEAIKRAGIDPASIDQVIMGNVLQAGQGQNPARQAAVKAGISIEIPAVTINKVCGSGLYAVNIAAALIGSGQAECVVAGGMESMSQAPHTIQMRWGKKMGEAVLKDSMIQEGLWDVFNDYHMGITAENVAAQYGITRQQQDMFSFQSQKKAAAAIASGRFREEIIPVKIPQRKGEDTLFDTDEYVRMDASLEKLQKLRPAFKENGTVTAGNASGINDGAAVMIAVSEDFLKKYGLKPQARWVCGASCGVDPSIMGVGPINTVKKALGIAGLDIDEIGLIEANEAFASQAVAVVQGIGADEDKVNVNGGAVAMGHPIGASGTRIAVTLLHEMKKRNEKYGLATLCIGGGMGEATIFERDGLCE